MVFVTLTPRRAERVFSKSEHLYTYVFIHPTISCSAFRPVFDEQVKSGNLTILIILREYTNCGCVSVFGSSLNFSRY